MLFDPYPLNVMHEESKYTPKFIPLHVTMEFCLLATFPSLLLGMRPLLCFSFFFSVMLLCESIPVLLSHGFDKAFVTPFLFGSSL